GEGLAVVGGGRARELPGPAVEIPPGDLVRERMEAGRVRPEPGQELDQDSERVVVALGKRRTGLTAFEQKRVPLVVASEQAHRAVPVPALERVGLLLVLAVRVLELKDGRRPVGKLRANDVACRTGRIRISEPEPPVARDRSGERLGHPRYPMARSRGVAQPGSALRSGRRGPQFESGHPDICTASKPCGSLCFAAPSSPSWRRAARARAFKTTTAPSGTRSAESSPTRQRPTRAPRSG